MKEAHINSGIRRILDWNFVYRTYQIIQGDYKLYKQVLKFAPTLNDKTVFDIGCGNGRLLDFLPISCIYKGYDFNKNYIARAREKYKGRNADFIIANINHTDFSERPADAIFLIGIIHHLTDEDVSSLFNKAKKNLAPNGVMISVDPVIIENQNVLAHYLIKRDRGTNVRTAENYARLTEYAFKKTTSHIYHNLINSPFNHIIQVSHNE